MPKKFKIILTLCLFLAITTIFAKLALANPIPSYPVVNYYIYLNNKPITERLYAAIKEDTEIDKAKQRTEFLEFIRQEMGIQTNSDILSNYHLDKGLFIQNKDSLDYLDITECYKDNCQFEFIYSSYTIPEHYKIALYLPDSDRLYISDSLEKAAKKTQWTGYYLNIDTNGKVIQIEKPEISKNPKPLRSQLLLFVQLLLLAIISETLIALLIFGRTIPDKWKLAFSIIISNIISYMLFFPFITAVLYTLPSDIPNTSTFSLFEGILIILGEIAVIIIEAAIINTIYKNKVKFKQTLLVSTVVNAFSLLISILIIIFGLNQFFLK